MNSKPPSIIRTMLETLTTDAERMAVLGDHLEALVGHCLSVNESLNLTSVRNAEDFWVRHIEDALRAAGVLETHLGPGISDAAILDVGSGGGIPGLVWGLLWPEATVRLLESRGKKARFLEDAASRLGLARLEVLCGRAEEVAREAAHRERYDLVTARALAPMPPLVELTLPFVRPGGWLGAIKGLPFEEEYGQAARAIEELGGDCQAARLENYERSDGKKCVVCLIPKATATPERYPRRAGVPVRRPLV